MKYLTLSSEKYVKLFGIVLMVLFIQFNATAQCSLSCHGTTQVSLSSTCDAEITSSMILSDNGASCPSGVFEVEVSDQHGVIPGINVVTTGYMGQTLQAKVTDTMTGNSCWGDVIIEDKLGPMIAPSACPDTLVLDCPDMNVFLGPTFTDNCDENLTPVLISESIDIPTPCDTAFIKEVTRVYTAMDNKGNVAFNNCEILFRLRRFNPDNVTFPDSLTTQKNTAIACEDATLFDVNGNGIENGEIDPTVTGSPFYVVTTIAGDLDTVSLFPFPDVYCNTIVTFEDIVLPKIGCTQKIMRRWTINEWHCDGERKVEYVQLIEIVDNQGPELTADEFGNCIINNASQITVSTNTLIAQPGSGDSYGDTNCGARISIPLPKATNNCESGISYDLSYDTGFEGDYNGSDLITLPMGTSTLLFTVYDDCYNSSQCHIPVEIIDDTPPIAICDQNTTVSVTSAGTADILASSFDDGSYDDCKLHCAVVRRMDNAGCQCRVPELCDLDYIGKFNGSNYYVSNYETSADIAKKRATAYGGALVKFENSEEEDWLVSNLRSQFYGEVLIGLKRFGSGFVWDDHSAITYNNFVGGAIPATGGDCVIINSDDNWQPVACSPAAFSTSGGEYRYLLEVPAEDDNCGFSSSVTFCCDDASATDENGNALAHMVVYRVVDFYGNFNDCMVNAFVQNKSIPALNCPPNQTIECDVIFDVNNLDLTFGSLSVGESCGSNIVPTVDIDLSECGIGTITRLWTAFESAEPSSSPRELTHCKQVITVVNSNPFDGANVVTCPEQDINLVGCNDPSDFGPEILGVPTFTTGQCDIIGADFDDQLFVFNNNTADACFKILRNWEIIDWCNIDPATNTFYRWTCAQVIKVVSDSRPLVTDLKREDICTFDPTCEGGLVELQATGEDACTTPENLTWTYSIINTVGQTVQTGSGDGDVASFSHFLDLGEYSVSWTFFNGCGSSTTETQVVTVSNCKSATAYCINGLAVDLMPVDSNNDGIVDDGMIELWAKDFDAGSSHPCGSEVFLSFSSDINDTNKTFGCTSVVNGVEVSGIGNQLVEIWATVFDFAGNPHQTFCTTFLDVQDNMGSCVNFSTAVNVTGSVTTEQSQTVENVEVSLKGSPMSTLTDTDGDYAFPSMPAGGNYVIDPYSNQAPLQGISTLDLIMIQRHILGIETLDSPYKSIAADIDNSNTIDGIDLVELRKLILGIYQEFPENDSWKFVDKSYAFTNFANPLSEAYAEDYQISNLNTNMDIDFVAIKIGDVNNSVDELISNNQTSSRKINSTTTIEIGTDSPVVSGGISTIPFNFQNEAALSGFQFNLDYNTSLVEVLEVKGINIDIQENNFFINNGSIWISWNTNIPVSDISFEVVVKTKSASIRTSELFTINSNGMNAEVYGDDLNITMPVLNGNTDDSFRLEQNSPNPFSGTTQLKLRLQKNEVVNFTISDLQGRLINSFNRNLVQGLNRVTINKEDLGEPGIYYLNVTTAQNKETIKMVLID